MIKELELEEPPPPYAFMCKNALKESSTHVDIIRKERRYSCLDYNAYFCNFRGICATISTPQAHFKIIPLHVCNSSNRPDINWGMGNTLIIFIEKI